MDGERTKLLWWPLFPAHCCSCNTAQPANCLASHMDWIIAIVLLLCFVALVLQIVDGNNNNNSSNNKQVS